MVGVVLEGGGAKGSYQVGALLALKKSKIKIDGIVGTSIGAINAAFVVQKDYKLLQKMWCEASSKEILGLDDEVIKKLRKLKIDKSVIKNSWEYLINTIKNRGIDNTRLREILIKNINEKKIRKSKIDYGLVTYNISDRKPIQVYKEDIPKGKLNDYILASAYFPLFKFEKIIDDKYYFDGGLYNNCPVNLLVDKGYDQIIVIRTHGLGVTRKVKNNDSDIYYVSNHKKLGSIIFFDQAVIKDNIKLGYYDALKVIRNLDGEDYYIKFKDDKYYDKFISDNIDRKLIHKLKRKFKAKTNKDLIIRSIEYILDKENLNKFKIYTIIRLIIYVKFKSKINNDIVYDFVRSLKLHL